MTTNLWAFRDAASGALLHMEGKLILQRIVEVNLAVQLAFRAAAKHCRLQLARLLATRPFFGFASPRCCPAGYG